MKKLILLPLFLQLIVSVPFPYTRFTNNLEEPKNVGFCLDLKGWNPPTFTDLQAHSCKPNEGRAGGGTDE